MLAIDLQRAVAKCNLVKKLYFDPQLDSTMTRAWNLVKEARASQCDGILVVTLHQLNGHGRQGRTWTSKAGKSLLFSLVLDELRSTSDPRRGLPTISNAVPVAVCRALQQHADVSIKYPNDIVCNGRKLAGVLIERAQVHSRTFVNIGIGINVGHQIEELPVGTNTPATSLFLETGSLFALDSLLAEICNSLNLVLCQTPEEIALDMSELCSTLGKNVIVDLGKDHIEGIAEGISAGGALSINTNGTHRLVNSGEIHRLHYDAEGF